ncbi:MAG: HAD-IA family hydrolase [Oscillospiraceae bacterium]|nr:HAD-IA family hydrolase [Oscillospiraceae bacterium]
MIKAVIFDMFETLVTHFESPVYMAKQICADIGITEPRFREIWDTTDEDRTLGKKTLEEVIEAVLIANRCYSRELFEMIINKRKQSKIECFNHIHPEVIPMFTIIKEMNIKIGLITNCYFEERDVIQSSVLYDYFDAVCMSCELGLSKPDTAIFQKCTQALEVAPDECLYVGDGGSFELEAAQAIGMHPIQAAWYLKEDTNQPAKRNVDFTQAESPMDIIREIAKYN